MHQARRFSAYLLAICLLAVPLTSVAANQDQDRDSRIKRVLLISVDGLHALDLTNYVVAHPNSTLAHLSSHGKDL